MHLSRTQYAHYKLNVEEIMDRYNWANIANGIELRPGSCSSSLEASIPLNNRDSVASQVRDWDRRDNSLKEFLLLSLPLEWKGKFNHVQGGGYDLWQTIVHEFENETPDSHTQLLAALFNIAQGNSESLENFVERLLTVSQKLEALGETVSTNTKVMCFFKGLNIIYKPEDVNILLEQQLSLEQAAQLIAEFADCKKLEHLRNHPPKHEVADLLDLNPTSPTDAYISQPSEIPAPVPPIKTAKFPVGTLIDVNSPASNASTSSGSSAGVKKESNPARPISPSVASPILTSVLSPASAAAHRTAFELTSLHRGLKNDTGENNCFLNVTIQALWHLGPFRTHLTSFIHQIQQGQTQDKQGKKHVHANGVAHGGLLEALCNLFVQYEFSDQAALPPTELRESLGAVSADFKLGAIADANEALDAILQRVHAEQSTSCPHVRKCLSHEVFGGNIMEQTICSRCNASSEPTLRSDFILTFQAAELLLEAKALFAKFAHFEAEESAIHPSKADHNFVGKMLPFNPVGGLSRFLGCARRHAYRNNEHDSPVGATVNSAMHETEAPHHYGNTEFGHILSKCMTLHQRSCPSREFASASPPLQSRVALLDGQGQGKKAFAQDLCNGRASVLQYSLDPPLAVALSIGWTSSNEPPATLQDFYDIIAYTIKLSDLFQVHGTTPPASTTASNSTAEHSAAHASSSASSGTAGSKTHGHGVGKDSRAQSPTWEEWISPEVSESNPSYVFRGLVCYYGKHYVSIFQGMDGGHDNFLLFDDHTIKPIGDWNAVKAKCVKSHYQPVLLLYELEKAKK